MTAMAKVPDDHPLMIAWEKYRATEEAANSDKWARTLDVSEPMQGQIIVEHRHLSGALWATFAAGFNAGKDDLRKVLEGGWVIEHWRSEPSSPEYWTATGFDRDNLKAIRFARKEDAERVSNILGGGFPEGYHRIADHMWCPR